MKLNYLKLRLLYSMQNGGVVNIMEVHLRMNATSQINTILRIAFNQSNI